MNEDMFPSGRKTVTGLTKINKKTIEIEKSHRTKPPLRVLPVATAPVDHIQRKVQVVRKAHPNQATQIAQLFIQLGANVLHIHHHQ